MSDYTKSCTYCHKDIRLSNDSGKWLPYEINTNEIHDCRDKQPTQQPQPQTQQKQVQEHKSQLTLEGLDMRLKVLRSFWF